MLARDSTNWIQKRNIAGVVKKNIVVARLVAIEFVVAFYASERGYA